MHPRHIAALLAAALASLEMGCSSGDSASSSASCSGQALTFSTVCAGASTVQGIDVSHYDGTVNWATVKSGKLDFAFMKATEGTTNVDPTFATNWSAAKSAGVVRGAYHFFHPELDPVTQATHFLQTLTSAGGLAPGDLPPVADVETTGSVAPATIAANLKTFLDSVKQATGMTPIIYTSPSFSNTNLGAGFSAFTLWVANWSVSCPDTPTGWSNWAFWQKADNGTVSGISGMANVDLDVFNGSLAELQNFGGAPADGGLPPPPPPSKDAGVAEDAGPPATDAGGGSGADGGAGRPGAGGGGGADGGAGSTAGPVCGS